MDRRAGHRGFSRSKPLKPLRAERRMMRRNRGDYARVLFTFAHEAADAFAHPAFRAPSPCESAGFMLPGIGQAHRPDAYLGRKPRRENTDAYPQ
jgi:hypothetical protein